MNSAVEDANERQAVPPPLHKNVISYEKCCWPWPGAEPEAVPVLLYMTGRSQMQVGKNWILPKEINANRFFWHSHWLAILKNHLCPSMGPNRGSVAMDSGAQTDKGQFHARGDSRTYKCCEYGSGRSLVSWIRIRNTELRIWILTIYQRFKESSEQKVQRIRIRPDPLINGLPDQIRHSGWLIRGSGFETNIYRSTTLKFIRSQEDGKFLEPSIRRCAKDVKQGRLRKGDEANLTTDLRRGTYIE